MKLKTLKDMNIHEDELISADILKQEAIKHIKDKRELQNKLIESADNYKECFDAFEYVIKWIKRFFNITWEDLKEKPTLMGVER